MRLDGEERRNGQSNDVDNANGGVYLPRKRNGTFSDEAICAGLVGAANLKIAAPTGGRGNRPYQKDEYRWAKKRRTLTRQKQRQLYRAEEEGIVGISMDINHTQ